MSYTCEKVNTVSSEIAESFWTTGSPYYITEGTLPKYTGSDTDNYNNFINMLTVNGTVESLYVVSLNDYPVVIVPAHDDGNKIKGEMILVRPDTSNSRSFLYTENGVWNAFVNFGKQKTILLYMALLLKDCLCITILKLVVKMVLCLVLLQTSLTMPLIAIYLCLTKALQNFAG